MFRDGRTLPRLSGGYGSALGFGVGVLTTTAAVAGGAAGAPWLGLVASAVAVLAVSVVTTLPGAALTAAQCWGLHAGFVLGRAGAVALDERAARAAAVFLAAALLGTGLGWLATRAGARHAVPAPRSGKEGLAWPEPSHPECPEVAGPVSGGPASGTAATPSPARS
ncbi:hypothetical protein LX15_005700 [Streptoalloteichus tenebrarius]|uniref:Integral membrane protein n=1 Tax=Streptoalloteichus tenebrarius (strain ATCC 17920 / DSM 40477 / JCM 4838 / CBS 697.72 / NBRC 16177 / NCIMB 11028 / NRRL B-12390 / A12253. 1 / ISP 5477) TaxID=1933 RepID=A0ABT1I2G1_STRSD|nr:hypothetical protein [Streptoalloteichus tenebrarius]MCP2261973.1 hypothetical protein [Streptoalloteichus tenebrarius]BFF01273.1 hypothetical protein GCM10020241_29480 [Streptoalloteichus tenebrarius]